MKFKIDWGYVSAWVLVATLIVGFVALAAWLIVTNNDWEDDCTDRGYFIVETHGEGTACVDNERRIIK